MQPYTFPYIGYYQLVNAVDLFVFFNDTNFIKRGWINRNTILNKKQAQPFSIPLVKISQNKKINETEIFDYSVWRHEFLKQLEFSYHRSPFFVQTLELINDILFSKDYSKIDELAAQSIIKISAYLGLHTQFTFSSKLPYHGNDGQEKILDICKKVDASAYINPINGAFLYNSSAFNNNHIELYFLEPVITKYIQFSGDDFTPALSIIDSLMFNSREDVLAMAIKNKLHKGDLAQ